MLTSISDSIGVPEDQLRLLVLTLMGFPLGFINYMIKEPNLRMWYGLITGVILQYNMYGIGKIL
jgi:hypothetical protein